MPPLSQDLILASTDDADGEDVDVAALAVEARPAPATPTSAIPLASVMARLRFCLGAASVVSCERIGSVVASKWVMTVPFVGLLTSSTVPTLRCGRLTRL